MKVFVTGGHGFLGRHLVKNLQTRGFEVVAPSRAECDLGLSPHTLQGFGFSTKPFATDLISLMTGCEVVIHAAADVGGLGFVQKDRLDLAMHNLRLSMNVLQAAEFVGVKLFVGIGSACSYPVSEKPLKESDFWSGPCDSSVEAYGVQKRVLESLGRQGPWSSLHLPLANLYGPGDRFDLERAHVLTALIKRVVDAKRSGATSIEAWSPDTEREMLYVEDAAKLIGGLVRRAIVQGEFVREPLHNIFNVGTGVCYRIDELMGMVQSAAGVDIPVFWNRDAPRGVRKKVLDVSQLRAVLGGFVDDKLNYVSLEKGIRKTVAWYEASLG